MADITTAVYHFTEPEVGASANTWGNKLNANWARIEALLLSGFEGGTPANIGKLKGSAISSDIEGAFTFTEEATFENGAAFIGSSVQLTFTETDQVSPAGRWRMLVQNDFLAWSHSTTVPGGFDGELVYFRLRDDIADKRAEVPDIPFHCGKEIRANEGTAVLGETGNVFLRAKPTPSTTGVGVLFRTDDVAFYILLTANNAADASFNTLRPLTINKTSGGVAIGTSLQAASLNFGTNLAASVSDVSKHIDLYNGTYGINVFGAHTSFIAPVAAFHAFYLGGAIVGRVEEDTTAAANLQTLMTRRKADARFAPIASSRRYKESITLSETIDNFLDLDVHTWFWGGEMEKDNPHYGDLGYGFIAEEVKQVFSEAVKHNDKGQVEGLDALALIGALFAEIKALVKRVSILEGAENV